MTKGKSIKVYHL